MWFTGIEEGFKRACWLVDEVWYRDRGRVQESLLVGGLGVVQGQRKGTGIEEGFKRDC